MIINLQDVEVEVEDKNLEEPVPAGAYCDHKTMKNVGGGHWECSCGIYWDDAAEGGLFFDDYEELTEEEKKEFWER